jgi:hypothetical protein
MSLAKPQLDNSESTARKVTGDASGDANLAPLSQGDVHDIERGFSLKEKWVIVGLASFAALYR